MKLLERASQEEVEPILAELPAVRGHAAAGMVVLGAGNWKRVELAPPDEDPPPLAPLVCRTWPEGDLTLWHRLDWEQGVEETARAALEAGQGIDGLKGASPALRAAFALCCARQASQESGIPFAPAELRRWLTPIIARGRPAALEALEALRQERAEHAARLRRPPPPPLYVPAPPATDERLATVLRAAGCQLLAARRAGNGTIEVRWSVDGVRLVSLVQETTLQVLDSGVCLDGQDDLVTLESLPGVIREAIRDDALVITRHTER